MSESEQDVVNKALAGLTMLDTLQSEEGASKVSDFAHTQQEKAVMKNIEFMESVNVQRSCILEIVYQRNLPKQGKSYMDNPVLNPTIGKCATTIESMLFMVTVNNSK